MDNINQLTAFPWQIDNGATLKGCKGMLLRDYFAAKALQGILACNYEVKETPSVLAYQYADEMMKAREL